MWITSGITCAQLSGCTVSDWWALRFIPTKPRLIHIVIPKKWGVIHISIGHRKLDRKRWGATRRLILIRDGYRCTKCGKAGRLEVDHIRPLNKGGDPWDHSNLQTLCRGCHIEKTKSEQARPKSPAVSKWDQLVGGL